MTREVGGNHDVLDVNMTLFDGITAYPYCLNMVRDFSGVRGNFQHDFSRDLTTWSGVTRTSTVTQSVVWSLDSAGSIAAIDSTIGITRPYPMDDGPVGSNSANPVIATETIGMDLHVDASGPVPLTTISQINLSYDNGIPDISGSNLVILTTVDSLGDGSACTTMAGSLAGAGQAFDLNSTFTFIPLDGDKFVSMDASLSMDGNLVYSSAAVFDPPATPVFGFWSKVKSVVTWTGKAIGTVAMVGTAVVGCSLTTAGGTAVAGAVTYETLGTATPLALGSVVAGKVACGTIATGAGYVIGKIWEQ